MARKKGWYWPWIVVAMLLVTVAANLTIIVLASRDPSFAVEPDYYRKAVAWDDHRAQDAANRALGWTMALEAVPALEAGVPSLRTEVTVLDREGVPVEGAAVSVEAFPIARASWIERAGLASRGGGAYAGALRWSRGGLWEFRVTAVRGDERFTRTLTKEFPVR